MGWFGKLSEKGSRLLGPPAVAVFLSGCGLFQQKPKPKQNEIFGGEEIVLQLGRGIEPGKYKLIMEVVDGEGVVRQIELGDITKQKSSQEEIKFPTAPLLRSYNQLKGLVGIKELRLYSLDGKGSNYTVLIQGEREKQLNRVKIDVVTNQIRMLLVEALSIVNQVGSGKNLQELISKILEIIEFSDLDRDRKHDSDDFVRYLKDKGLSTEVLEGELGDEIAGYVQAYMRGEISEESLRRLLWDILYPYFVQQEPEEGNGGDELPPDDEDTESWQMPEGPSWEDMANDIINQLSNLKLEIADEIYHLTPEQGEQLEARLQELNKQLQQLQSTIEQLQTQLQQLGDKIEANQDSWDAARQKLQQLIAQKASLEEQMGLLAEILKKNQITQQDIERLLAASASGQSQSTSGALATTLGTVTTLSNEVDLDQLDQELLKELRNINRVIDLLQQKLDEIRSELYQINRQISDTIDQINSTQREINRLEDQQQQLEDEISQMRSDYDRLMQLKPTIDSIIDLYLQYKQAKAEADRANQERISALDRLEGHVIDPIDMSGYSYYTSKTTTYNGHTITWSQYVTYVNGRASYPAAICAESLGESVGTCLRIRNSGEKQPWGDYYETYVYRWIDWKLAVRDRNNKYNAFNSQAQAHRSELEETRTILRRYGLTYNEIDQIPDKIRALERQKRQLEDEIATLRDRLNDLNVQLERLQDEKDELERQKQQVQAELDRAQQRKSEIEQQLGVYRPVVEEAQDQIPPLKDEEQTKQAYADTNQQLDEVQQDYERLERERQRIEEALNGGSNELKPYDLMFVDEDGQEYRDVNSLPINPSFWVPGGYGSQEYIKTPFTIYVQYGINNDGTNYPAKVWLEYIDGDTVKQTNVYEVNNYGQKETVKWELIDMYSQTLEQLYEGEYEYRGFKYWLRQTEDGRWWGYYEVGGVKMKTDIYDSAQITKNIIERVIDKMLGSSNMEIEYIELEGGEGYVEITLPLGVIPFPSIDVLTDYSSMIGDPFYLNRVYDERNKQIAASLSVKSTFKTAEALSYAEEKTGISWKGYSYKIVSFDVDKRIEGESKSTFMEGLREGIRQSIIDQVEDIENFVVTLKKDPIGVSKGIADSAVRIGDIVGDIFKLSLGKSIEGRTLIFNLILPGEDVDTRQPVQMVIDVSANNLEKTRAGISNAIEEGEEYLYAAYQVLLAQWDTMDANKAGYFMGYLAGSVGGGGVGKAGKVLKGTSAAAKTNRAKKTADIINELVQGAKNIKKGKYIENPNLLNSLEKIGGSVSNKTRKMVQTLEEGIFKKYNVSRKLAGQLPDEELEMWIDLIKREGKSDMVGDYFRGIDSSRIQRYVDYNAYKKARLVDVAKDIFANMKTNEILDHMPERITSGKEVLDVARKVRYNFDWRIGKGGAVIVKGDYEVGAKELMRRLENSGWKKTEKVPGKIYLFEDTDNKRKINIRTISSSRGEFENYGYNIEATVDIINLTLPKGAGGRQREIKFILLNK